MDFDDDFGDDFCDDGFMDEEPFEDSLQDEDQFQDDAHEAPLTDTAGGLDWEDIAFLGAISEEIAEERKRRAQILREMEKDEEDRDRDEEF